MRTQPVDASLALLPDALRAIYLDAFVAALQPVFRAAAVVACMGFGLTWLLREVPLRGPARAEDIGDGFAMPRHATSLEELEAIVMRVSRDHRWRAIKDIAERLELDLQPDEIWLFTRLGRTDASVELAALANDFSISAAHLDRIASRLAARGLATWGDDGTLRATDDGRSAFQ